jgi:hypothetical protein
MKLEKLDMLKRREGRIKENDGGGEFNYVRAFVSVIIYPQYSNNIIIKNEK